MSARISKVVRAMCGWPLLGQPVRIAAALVRLPDWRDRTDYAGQLRQQHQATLGEQLSALGRQMAALEGRLAALDEHRLAQDGQLAALDAHRQRQEDRLAALDEHRLAQQDKLAAFDAYRLAQEAARAEALLQPPAERPDDGRDNLLKSVPVALRKFAFDLNELQQQHRGTQATLANVSDTTDYLLGRTEFVRRELMFEMRYGAGSGAPAAAAPQAIAPERLAAARRDGVRLNLGCGHLPLPGYLNVDRRPLPGVDLVAEVDALPFGPGEVREISSAHLLEHFPQEQLRRQLLPYFYALLEDGGRLCAVVPDAAAMVAAYAGGSYPYDDLREVLYGAQDYDGDFHFNMFTPASLSALLEQAGFVDIVVLDAARKNGRCYEFELSASKPAAR